MKTIGTILLCFMAITAFTMPIQERIQNRILEEIGNDTAIRQMIEEGICTDTSIEIQRKEIINEEIQSDVVVIPIVKIPIITIDMITIEVIKAMLVGMDKIQVEALIIKVYDVSAQAINLRESIDITIASIKLNEHIKNKNWVMCSNVLQKAGVDKKVVDVLIASIGKVPPPVTMPFFECKMARSYTYKGRADENAFIVGNYKEEVRQGDVVIFDVTSDSNLVKGIKFIEKNKDKIGAVIIGWDSDRMNNYDNLDITTYPEVMKWYFDFYSICKGIKPDLPVGVIACMTITWEQWLDACIFKWDFIALWNITKLTANFNKIKNTYFRNEEVMIFGMNAVGRPLKQRFDSDEYRNYINKLKRLGFCGSIWVKTKGGE